MFQLRPSVRRRHLHDVRSERDRGGGFCQDYGGFLVPTICAEDIRCSWGGVGEQFAGVCEFGVGAGRSGCALEVGRVIEGEEYLLHGLMWESC